VSLTRSPRTPLLRHFVSALGYYEGTSPAGRELVLPTAMSALMINLAENEFRTYDRDGPDARVHRTGGVAVSGPSSRACVIDTMEQACNISVSFTAGGMRPFIGMPAAEMADALVDVDDVWGRGGRVFRERVLEAPTPEARLDVVEEVLLERLDDLAAPNPALAFSAPLLDRNVPVAEVASRMGWIPGTLTRHFRDQVGLTPKRFARVRRLQRVLRSVTRIRGPADWAEVAVTHGYYDQAHLINDFRTLTGLTPTAYRPRVPWERNHVPLDSSNRDP
jgi:AraC-like DNA-binding protein